MNNDADNIITEVFRLTGTRITRDDPILAVLVMQRRFLQQALDELNVSHDAFLKQIDARERNITAAAAKLETYREQLLSELSQHAGNQILEAEPRIYAAVSARIAKDTAVAHEALVDRLKTLLVMALSVVLVLMALFVLYVAW